MRSLQRKQINSKPQGARNMKTYSIPPHLKPEAIESLDQAMKEQECPKCEHKQCETCKSKAIIDRLKGRVDV